MGLFDVVAKIGKGAVSVRGESIDIRMLRESESLTLLRLFPTPVPPMMPDPSKGSLAAPIPNYDDPAYVLADRAWTRQRWVLEVLVATGQVKLSGSDAEVKKQLEDGIRVMTGADSEDSGFSEKEISRMFNAVRELYDRTAQQRVLDALVVDVSTLPADALADPIKVPADFGTTQAFRTLEVCKCFGIDPRTIADTDPGLMAVMAMAVEVFRKMEVTK